MTKLFLCLVLLISCRQSPNQKNENKTNEANIKPATTEVTTDSKYIDDYIINTIIEYYKDSTTRMETEETDSSLSIVFYHIPTSHEDSLIWEVSYELEVGISKLRKDYIFGDLDKDGIPDLIADIGGNNSGSGSWNELFVFFSKNGRYELASVTPSSKICGCTVGDFYPEKIQEGLIFGESICWAENDAHCCPTLHYSTTVTIDKKQLKFSSKKETK